MLSRIGLSRILLVATVSSTLSVALTSQATAATFYVRVTGNNSQPGTNPNQAFKTIDRARTSARAGDIVYVGAGTYAETVKPAITGTANSPIRYIADTTGAHTGDAGEVCIAAQGNYSFSMNGAAHTYIEGFTFRTTASQNHGIYAKNCDGLRVLNCAFQATRYGVYAENSEATVTGCSFNQTKQYGVISYYRNLTVSDSVITSSGNYAIYHSAPAVGQTRYTLNVVNCQITGNYGGPYANSSDLILDATTITGNTYWGAAAAYGDITFRGGVNGIQGNGYGLYLAGNGTNTKRIFTNCTFSATNTYGIYTQDCDLVLNNCTVSNVPGYGMYLMYSTLDGSRNSVIQNCGHGVATYSQSTMHVSSLKNLQILNNNGYGIYHYSYPTGPTTLTVSNCQVDGNKSYALLSYYGNIDCINSQFVSDTLGLYLYREARYGGIQTHRFDSVLIKDIQWHGIYAPASGLNLTNCEVRNVKNFGVRCWEGNLSVANCVFDNVGIAGAGYAISHISTAPVTTNSSSFMLLNTSVTNCYAGVNAENTNLTIDNSKIELSKAWGLVVLNGELTATPNSRVVSKNGNGLYVAGNPPSGSRDLQGWDVSQNGTYGIYAADCTLKLTDCKITGMTSYGLGLVNTVAEATRSPIYGNGHGVVVTSIGSAQAPSLTNFEIYDNAGYGLLHSSNATNPNTCTLASCTLRSNGSYSIYSSHGNMTLKSCLVENTTIGLYFNRNEKNAGRGAYLLQDTVVRNITNWHGLYSAGGAVTLERCQFVNVSNYGVYCSDDNLTATDCTFDQLGTKNTGYAIYHSDLEVDPEKKGNALLRSCAVTNSFGGIYANLTSLTIDNCKIEYNRYWAVVSYYGQLDVLNQAKAIQNNGYGLYVAGNTSPEGRVLEGWTLSNNGQYGLYALDCDLVLKDCTIEKMTGWAMALSCCTLRAKKTFIGKSKNGLVVYSDGSKRASAIYDVEVQQNTTYGIYHSSSTASPTVLRMERCKVHDNGSYSLRSDYGTIDCVDSTFEDNGVGISLVRNPQYGGTGEHTFKNCTLKNITGWHGIVASYANLNLDNCRVQNCRDYGVYVTYGNVVAKDCTIDGAQKGYAVYLLDNKPNLAEAARATLQNCRITNNYGGPYVDRANLTIDNCTIERNKYWAIYCNYGDFEFQNQANAVHKNGYGIYVAGNLADNQRVLSDFDVSENGNYGIYAVNCNLVLEDCTIEKITGYGLAVLYGTLRTVNSPICNNTHGVMIYSQASSGDAIVEDLDVHDNSGYGIYHYSQPAGPSKMILRRANVRNNGSYALYSAYGDLECDNVTFDKNARGLYLTRDPRYGGIGQYQLRDTTVTNTSAWHGIYSTYGKLDLVRCRVENSRNYGIQHYYADLNAEDCVFTGNGIASGYAVYHVDNSPNNALWSKGVLKNCQIRSNFGGPYANRTHLTLDNCDISLNRSWGLVCSYGDLKLLNISGITNNGSGISLSGNDSSGNRFLKDLNMSSNGSYGLYATDCDVVLENCAVQKMTGWGVRLANATIQTTNTPIKDCANGMYIASQSGQREPTLVGLNISNSTGYGLYFASVQNAPSKLTLRQCRIEGSGTYGVTNMYGKLEVTDTRIIGNRQVSNSGVYSYLSPQATLERVTVMNHRGWGLLSYGNNLLLRNSIIANNANGTYLYNYNANTTATLYNSTLANNSVYGIVQSSGRSSIVNCIIASSAQGTAGLYNDRGITSHSYNLLFGYRRPYIGTAAGTGELQDDPSFENAVAGDFTLKGSSEAINTGCDMPGLVDYDIVGVTRPMFGKWEMGAYEYTKPSGSAHVVQWNEVK